MSALAAVDADAPAFPPKRCRVSAATLAALDDDGQGNSSSRIVLGKARKPGIFGSLCGTRLAIGTDAVSRKAAFLKRFVRRSMCFIHDGIEPLQDGMQRPIGNLQIDLIARRRVPGH